MQMKLAPLVLLSFLAFGSPTHALDCAKASSAGEKLICATPELKKADKEMGTAYFTLLRETTDPDFHKALIESQRRWLKVRSFGPDRFGLAENDTTDDREVLLRMTRVRLTFLQTAKPIRVMEQERQIMSKDSGGPFTGFQTYCVLQPPPYGSWDYECWGDAHRQQNGRICSSLMRWASGHWYEYRLVSVLNGDKPKPVAICSAQDDTMGARCPEPDLIAETHWNTKFEQSAGVPNLPDLPNWGAGDLWKYDPDIEPNDVIGQAWMHDCLVTPGYPPVEAGHAKE